MTLITRPRHPSLETIEGNTLRRQAARGIVLRGQAILLLAAPGSSTRNRPVEDAMCTSTASGPLPVIRAESACPVLLSDRATITFIAP